MCWLWWCILLVLSVKIRAFNCPTGMGCGTCLSHPDGLYEIDCKTSAETVFKVQIRPGTLIKLICPVGPVTNWIDLYLGATRPIEGINALSFAHCDLPKGERLGKIARQLLHENVERLDFQSYKNIGSLLTREHLRGFNHIKNLTLSSNSLSQLPEDLLQDFVNLTLLNLRENNLRKLPKNFLRAPMLQILELGVNKFETLAPNTFDKLEHLLFLNIWNNKIVKILKHTFDNLVSLKTLDIHRNVLEALPSDIFSRLRELKIINLSQNNFTENSLPANLLRNNSQLETVSMFDNKRNMTTLPGGFFANLTKLGTVKLRKNGFTWLPEDLFWGATNLQSISLERNYLSTLPSKIFRDAHNLHTLNLNFNDFQSLPDEVFSSLGKLVMLDLSKNHLTTISDKLFSGLLSLRELNVERNKMTIIHFNAFTFLQHLRIAKFSNNALTLRPNFKAIDGDHFGLVSPFQPCQELEELYLEHNNITDVFEDWKYTIPTLRILNLAHNHLQSLQATDLQYFSAKNENSVKIDFTFNNISHIDLRTVEPWAMEQPGSLTISIGNNPIRCDCSLYDLLRYLEGRMHPNVQNAFRLEVGRLKCKGPNDYRGIVVSDLSSKTLKCDVKSVGEEMHCPDKCNCYVRPDDKAFLVSCAYKGLTEAPKKLESPPYHHVELNLSGNFLTEMPTFDLPGYNKITILTLDHNYISTVSLNTLSNNLQVLKLNDNNLTRLQQDVTDFFKNSSSLKSLTLQANPWICDCEARDLLSFIQYKAVTIPDLLGITCQGQDIPISEMTPEELCPMEIEWIIGGCLAIAFLGIVVSSLAALYYRYQGQVKVWLYSRQWCLWCVTEDELDKDKLYDAFISYSHKDEDFVVNDLVPKLEEGPRPFKLCIHFRDWLAGEWIPKQIARSVEESRRTIVVLSPNFLESVWGRMEFRAAHSQALSEGRARVVVVLFGDIGPTENLDSELKAYLSMNTYVKWGDPWFWEKLKYALPHPPEFTKKNMGKKMLDSSQRRNYIGNDTRGLIDISGFSSAPLSVPMSSAGVSNVFVPNGTHNESDKVSVQDS